MAAEGVRGWLVGLGVQAFALLAAAAGARTALRQFHGGSAAPPLEELLRGVTGDSRLTLTLVVALLACFLVAYVGAKLMLKSLALSLKLSLLLLAAGCLALGLVLLAL